MKVGCISLSANSTQEKNTPGSSKSSLAGKWGPRHESMTMYFLLKNGDFPASHVSLPEGNTFVLIKS